MESSLKRFLVFCGNQFYPQGGWKDFRCSFETVENALAGLQVELSLFPKSMWKFGYVVDSFTAEIIPEVEE